MNVLVADHLSDEGIQILKAQDGLKVDVKIGLSPKELAGIIKPYEGLIVRSSTKVTAEVIQKADRLKVIGRAGVGLDNVDVDAATKRGIIVMNVPGGNTISAAEHTMSLLLALARHVPRADAHLRAGKWERAAFTGTELFGKTLGVVGLGKIGSEVAKRAQAFGMRILAHDPFLSTEHVQQLEAQVVGFDELLESSDFITLHVPLTSQTRHLIGPKEFKKMRKGVRLINCARGGIIDEAELANAIGNGTVAGAALDVFEQEPPGENPLFKLPQIVVTPHLGAATEEAQLNVAIEVAKQVADTLLGRGIRNAVNMPSVDAKTLQLLQPYITLGEKMGSLAAQLVGAQVAEVRVTFVGEVTQHNTAPVTLAVLKGILEPMVGESVNYVNASFIASERGVKLVEAKSNRSEEFANLVTVEVISDGTRLELQGTLSVRREPRIVKIDRFVVEAVPTGYMLVIKNHDKPGLIGHLGTVLGDAKINIAGMSNGREKPGGLAVTVVNVDQAVSPNVLAKIKTFKQIIDAKLISL
ncbi:MAG: phosphoglycerate dehydrogenase [Candidatus Omnitrophica bacterium]|nr:phosphoglycerate dehydrogenase [Candidatus Omnitrophota bacterium]